MKRLKKLSCLVLAMALAFSLCIPSYAVNDVLEEVAAETIQVSGRVDEQGNYIKTYSNLAAFVDSIHESYPNISDYDIVAFIMDYTEQDTNALHVEDALFLLELDNISSTVQVVDLEEEVDPYGVMPAGDTYIYPTGKMKFVTDYSYTGTVNGHECFLVWSTATWLEYPAFRLTDVFAFSNEASFDSAINEFGSLTQSWVCRLCNSSIQNYRRVDYSDYSDNGLTLLYSNAYPYLDMDVVAPSCTCGSTNFTETQFSAYLRFGVRLDVGETATFAASYCHSTINLLGSITVNIGSQDVEYNATPQINLVVYNARGVTLDKNVDI